MSPPVIEHGAHILIDGRAIFWPIVKVVHLKDIHRYKMISINIQKHSGQFLKSSTSKISSNASRSRQRASFKTSSVTFEAAESCPIGISIPRRLSSRLSSMVCVRVVEPFHLFGAISASMVATLPQKGLSEMMISPAIRFVVLVENRTGRGSFAGHPVIVRLVNELLVSAPRSPALLDFSHIIRKSGEIGKTNHEACHFQCIESLSPWQGQNFPLLVFLIGPTVLFVPQTGRSCSHLRMNRRAVREVLSFIFCILFQKTLPPVCDIGAVHIKEELALRGQRVPTHVTSANAARRSVGVGSEDIFFNC